MEAKATVMTREQYDDIWMELWGNNIIKRKNEPASLRVFSNACSLRQAEISFKAGQKDAYFKAGGMVRELIDSKLARAKQAGMKKVVEWIRGNAIYSHDPSFEHIRIDRKEWDSLEKGIIPKERKHIVFGKPNLKSGV